MTRSKRINLLGRLVAAGLIVASGVAFLAIHGNGKTQAYKAGWDFVVTSLKSAKSVGQAGSPFVDCQSAAVNAFPGSVSYGVESPATFQQTSDWSQGCSDALNWISTSGLSGDQVPIF